MMRLRRRRATHDTTTHNPTPLEEAANAALDTLRRSHLIVRTGREWIAYQPGRRGRWDQWRAIQMLGGLDSDRVETRATIGTLSDTPHNGVAGASGFVVPDAPPKEWV